MRHAKTVALLPFLILAALIPYPSPDQQEYEHLSRIATQTVFRAETGKSLEGISDCLLSLPLRVINLTNLRAQGGSDRVLANPVRNLLVRIKEEGSSRIVTVSARPGRPLLPSERQAFSGCTA